ncbi:MAG: putative glycosylase [Frankiales bacterium]|nr:putative glycosylase [Frankiales bacterium]
MLGTFTPYLGNPVLGPTGDGWQSANVYNPAAVVHDGRVVLLYRAHAADKVSRIGLAASDDGLHFEREDEPVLEPTEDYERFGCEDPRVTLVEGTYYLTYTGWDRSTPLLCLATSTDLRTWTKHGPVLPELDTWQTLPWAVERRGTRPHNKAGGILPVQVGGRWHMYVGEGAIYHATSSDLLAWTVGDSPLVEGRAGMWDEDLIEVGAAPVVVGDRVVLLVNGARITSIDDLLVDYRCGQIAFALDDPARVVERGNEPFLQPSTPEERAGLVPNVTFVEGLVRFRDRWFAYYGQRDTTTAVAVSDG